MATVLIIYIIQNIQCQLLHGSMDAMPSVCFSIVEFGVILNSAKSSWTRPDGPSQMD